MRSQLKIMEAKPQGLPARIALHGPSKSGKTFSGLALLNGLIGQRDLDSRGKILVIDSERGRSRQYGSGSPFWFDILVLPDFDVETYIAAISLAREKGYPALMIDSATHAWKALLDYVDSVATKGHGNKWAAWAKGTPLQMQFIDSILQYPGDILMTMRSRTEWEEQINEKGKKQYVRVGRDPIQGKEIEYEFDMFAQLELDHTMVIEGARDGIRGNFQERMIRPSAADRVGPCYDLGAEVRAFLDGEAVIWSPELKTQVATLAQRAGVGGRELLDWIRETWQAPGLKAVSQVPARDSRRIIQWLNERYLARRAELSDAEMDDQAAAINAQEASMAEERKAQKPAAEEKKSESEAGVQEEDTGDEDPLGLD